MALSDRDAFGRPRLATRTVDGTLETSRATTTDARGRVTSISLATPTRSGEVAYGYYDNGLLASVRSDWGSGREAWVQYLRSGTELQLASLRDGLTGATLASFSARDTLGRATQVDLLGGAEVRTGYDLAGRVEWRRAQSGPESRLKAYGYDYRGRVESIETTTPSSSWTREFTYEEPGWLAWEELTVGLDTETTVYGYDAAGNRLSRAVTTVTGSGSTTVTTGYAYAYGNRLTSVDGVSTSWNAFGEQVADHDGRDIGRPQGDAERAGRETRSEPADEAGRRA